MKVKLIQVDGKIPNLALMKISSWHKSKGDEVGFDIENPEKVYISCIFKWNKSMALGVAKMFDCSVEVGGYGINGMKLKDEIEHSMPDYSLYNMDYSMGFITRGCTRKCPFCDVWRTEGMIRCNSPLIEFQAHEKILLLDNNLLASPHAEEILQNIQKRNLKVCFNQGLDIRLMTKEIAGILQNTNVRSLSFKERRLYISWDQIGEEEVIYEGLILLKNARMNMRNIMCYMLTCFDSTLKDDLYRFNKLCEWGVDPYVMRYNRKGQRVDREFARWVNKRWYKSFSFEKWLGIRKVPI